MYRIAFVIALVLISTVVISSPAAATGGPAPTLNTNSANCFRNIIEDGDIYCLMRYQLPTFVTATPPPVSAEAWCAELVDQDGCTSDPVEPTNETSLITGAAFVTLYQNCGVDCSTGTLESQVRTPRINHALGGSYLAAGHGVTWGDPTVNGCVESSATLFTVTSRDCLPVIWNAAASDESTQRTELGAALVGNLVSIESNRNLSLYSYVSNNLITRAGRILSVEALSVMDQIIPERFQAASFRSQDTAFATPTGILPLQASLDAKAAAAPISTAFTNLGTSVFGISGGAFATILFVTFAVAAFAWFFAKTKSLPMGTTAAATVAMVGIYTRGPTVSVIAVGAVGIGLVAAMFIIGKIRT